jgi:DNA-binding NtrC family response regulator
MRTVLVVEDSFLESYELEYRLQELGYAVQIVATLEAAKERFRGLGANLAAIVCDNRLLRGEPIGSKFYTHVRSRQPSMPFVVYSGFPPQDLPKDDPLLASIRKPFMDDVIKHLRRYLSILDKKPGGLCRALRPIAKLPKGVTEG